MYIFFYTNIQENAKQLQDMYRSAMLENKTLKLIENQKMTILRYMHVNMYIYLYIWICVYLCIHLHI